MKKSLIIIFLALLLVVIGFSKTSKQNIIQPSLEQSFLSQPPFHIFSPDGRFVNPSALRTGIVDGSVVYVFETPGKWSVLITEKASDSEGKKLYNIPTQIEIERWKQIGIDILKVNVSGYDAYIRQVSPSSTIPGYSSLDMTKGGVDINIMSLKLLDTNTLIKIAQSLK